MTVVDERRLADRSRRVNGESAGREGAAGRRETGRIIEVPDMAAMISRCLRAIGRRAGESDPESLRLFAQLRDDLDAAEHAAIQALLAEGYSWRDMGRALGQHHTAVFNRYSRYEARSS